MAEEPKVEEPVVEGEITENDKLMAAISYPIPIVGIIILLSEDMKARPFQKYHAVQSLVANVVLWVVIALLACVLGAITFFVAGCGGLLPLVLWLLTFYGGYLAYQGEYFEIPVLTDFMKTQGWVE